MEYAGGFILISAIIYFAWVIYKFFNPELVQIEDKFYVRRFDLILGWCYMDNQGTGRTKHWWSNYCTTTIRWCQFNSAEQARSAYQNLYSKTKEFKVTKLKLKGD